MSTHTEKKSHLSLALAETSADGRAAVGLAKRTSNLFRDRAMRVRPKINLASFDEVIRIDPAMGVVQAEGMIPYVALADATLRKRMMPAVVPQFKSITLGGALAGVGIESSSFRHGLVHDTITAIEVLTGDGRILTCTPENEHRDLFFGLPNSYGTLGYALAVTARTVPVKPFVALEHVRYKTADACFAAVARHCEDGQLDFLDGVVFGPDELYLTLGRFVENAPYTSDYTFEHIYYRSIRERASEFLAFLHREIGILPIWLCPIRAPSASASFTLYPLRPETIYMNFGFWDIVRDRARHPPGHRNRLIERKVAELSGWKSLYSDSYYTPEEFWRVFDHAAYFALKRRYDPGGVLPDLYPKCVLRQ